MIVVEAPKVYVNWLWKAHIKQFSMVNPLNVLSYD